MTLSGFETRLVDGIEPVRQFVLAASLYHLIESGLYDRLGAADGVSLSDLAGGDLQETRVSALLKYLRNEGVVEAVAGGYRLSPRGRQYGEFRGWYTMLIGGYGGTFLEIGDKLRHDTGWAGRDATRVGIGSCDISRYDAIPLTRSLMRRIPRHERLLDLGCGNGRYLAEFCQAHPDIDAVGVEPDEGGFRAATALIKEAGLDDRVTLYNATVQEFLHLDVAFKPDFMVLGFVLHEILGQDGRAGAGAFLAEILRRFPEIYIVVIEVADRIDDPAVMAHALARAYYNPYYLYHAFTQQSLQPERFWEDLFLDCGLEVVETERPNVAVDSTGLEVGYLVRRAGA